MQPSGNKTTAIFHTFLFNLVIQGCNIITGILTARILHPLGRGELATIILWPSIFAGIGIMGTNWALAREAATPLAPDDAADLDRSAVILSLALSLPVVLGGYYLVPCLLTPDKQHLTFQARLFLLWVPLNFLSLNLIALDHGRLQWSRFNMLRLSVSLGYVPLLIFFWVSGIQKVEWFVAALLLSNAMTAGFCLTWHWPGIRQGRNSFGQVRRLLSRGLPFFYAAAAGLLLQQLDKALMVSLQPADMVGLYAVAFTVASAHDSLGGALGFNSFAQVANELDCRTQGLYVAQVFRQASLLYVGAGAVVALGALWLIVPLFGREFAPAVGPALVLVLYTSLVSLGNVLNEGMRGQAHTAPGVSAQLLASALIALAAWNLVPRFGLLGMAWSCVLGGVAQLAVLLYAAMSRFTLSSSDFWGLRFHEVKALYGRLQTLKITS